MLNLSLATSTKLDGEVGAERSMFVAALKVGHCVEDGLCRTVRNIFAIVRM
jgi:hypothetical protein